MPYDRTPCRHTPAARRPRFRLGQLVATPGALLLLACHQVNPLELIGRHITGDFGDLDAEDQQRNEEAIEQGARVFSSYRLPNDEKVWCITEWDRSVTTLLLPVEY